MKAKINTEGFEKENSTKKLAIESESADSPISISLASKPLRSQEKKSAKERERMKGDRI